MINKNNIFPIFLYLLFLIIGAIFLLVVGSITTFDIFHNTGKPYFNNFFVFITTFAEEFSYLVTFILIIFLKNYRTGISLIAGLSFAGLTTQILKKMVFHDWHRPAIKLWNSPILSPPDFVQLNYSNSFPSGHATAAFAIFGVLAIFGFKNPILKFALMSTAILVAHSRVYIGHHFVEDILMGSAIGLVLGGMIFYYVNKKLQKYSILSKSLLNRSFNL
jgi:membrane-associated phospholipid phosphatase